jgi:hypothetical protein
VLALALVGVCAGSAVAAWAFDAPDAGAALLACACPGIVLTVYEVLKVLDGPVDEATRRSCWLALALLLVPVLALMALVARMGQEPYQW